MKEVMGSTQYGWGGHNRISSPPPNLLARAALLKPGGSQREYQADQSSSRSSRGHSEMAVSLEWRSVWSRRSGVEHRKRVFGSSSTFRWYRRCPLRFPHYSALLGIRNAFSAAVAHFGGLPLSTTFPTPSRLYSGLSADSIRVRSS